MTNQLREEVVVHCLTLERIDGDSNALGNLFLQLALNLLTNLLLIVGVLVMLWRIGLVLTPICETGLVAVKWLRRAAMPPLGTVAPGRSRRWTGWQYGSDWHRARTHFLDEGDPDRAFCCGLAGTNGAVASGAGTGQMGAHT